MKCFGDLIDDENCLNQNSQNLRITECPLGMKK